MRDRGQGHREELGLLWGKPITSIDVPVRLLAAGIYAKHACVFAKHVCMFAKHACMFAELVCMYAKLLCMFAKLVCMSGRKIVLWRRGQIPDENLSVFNV